MIRKKWLNVIYHQIVVLILVTVFVAACASTPTSTLPSTPTTMPPTPTALPATPTISPPTVTPTAMPPTPTALPAASPSPHPTDVATAVPTSQPATGETQIRVIIGDTVLTGYLWNNATARDLIAQLPLTLTFSDYNAREKIAPLPRKLSTEGMPAGDDPLPRDIGYYAPWGNFVFYYGDVGYFNGIVRIGQFDGNMETISSQTGDFTARIELAN